MNITEAAAAAGLTAKTIVAFHRLGHLMTRTVGVLWPDHSSFAADHRLSLRLGSGHAHVDHGRDATRRALRHRGDGTGFVGNGAGNVRHRQDGYGRCRWLLLETVAPGFSGATGLSHRRSSAIAATALYCADGG